MSGVLLLKAALVSNTQRTGLKSPISGYSKVNVGSGPYKMWLQKNPFQPKVKQDIVYIPV